MKFQHILQNILAWIADRFSNPGDPENLRIRKSAIALGGIIILPINVLWDLYFLSLGLYQLTVASAILGLFFVADLVYYYISKNARVYLHILFALNLGIAFSWLIFLGGFVQSGLYILIGMIFPIIGAVVMSRAETIIWAVIYLAVLGLSFYFDADFVQNAPDLPPSFGLPNGFFTVVVLVVLGTTIVLYLVRKLEEAQDRADDLLYNMLPAPVAEQLKHGASTIAEHYNQVSILFTDMVGFTPIASHLSAKKTVEILNKIYTEFDALVEKHRAEKITTIGDSYMVAAGLPISRPDHAKILANLALDMVKYIESLELNADARIRLRVGINSGPAVAGVIGRKKFQYDVWGDTVNTASRMESHGEPGKIQITKSTYDLIKDEFVIEPRGTLDIKGKGPMETYLVIDRR